MTSSDDLTTEQAFRLHEALFPHVNFLLRLVRRMEELRFPSDDPLRLAAQRAYDTAWDLYRTAHSLSVPPGTMGR